MELGLKNKTAIVTGTNNPQGIGAATALALASEGVRIALVYKRIPHKVDDSKTGFNGLDRYFKSNSGDMTEVENKLKAINSDFIVLESDISDEQCVKDIFDRAITQYGKVDILVNNAAAADDGDNDTIDALTQSVIDYTFATNVRGTLLMVREFVKRRGSYGRIINFSTDAAQAYPGVQITYSASKAATEAFTRNIAIGVGKYGITVNCISPGPTQTGWIDTELETTVLPHIPLGRLIQPKDIADTVVFLASERAAMVTGQVIKVSGGHAL
ncbi:MAG: SDR family oxidoreductase [Deltaproteobacteria bacterium]|jgi:3-oxoacyl-[acyl-carrier protein] reductase|nr:SDR family oxidoreductase [Deltaproteobacteria bacterium]